MVTGRYIWLISGISLAVVVFFIIFGGYHTKQFFDSCESKNGYVVKGMYNFLCMKDGKIIEHKP